MLALRNLHVLGGKSSVPVRGRKAYFRLHTPQCTAGR